MKRVLAVGAGPEQLYAIEKAKELGLYVIAVDGNKYAVGFKLADESYCVDIKDKKEVLEIAKKCHITAVLPVPIGCNIITIGYINEKLKLVGPKEYAAQTCADKKMFYDFFVKHEINCAQQVSALSNNFKQFIQTIQYPIIAKPRLGSGSKGVKVLNSLEETEGYLDEVKNRYGELLIEEFIEGIEYGIDIIVVEGHIIFFNIREKKMTPLPYRQEVGYVSPADLSRNKIEDIQKYFQKIITLLKIEDSLCHADIIVTRDNKIFVIDMSPRPGGLNIMNKILKYNTETEIILEWIKYIIGECKLEKINIKHIVGLNYLQLENRFIKHVPDEEEIKRRFKLKKVHFLLQANKWLGRIKNGRGLEERGYFIIIRDSHETLEEDSLEVLKYIDKVVEENES